MRYHGVAILIIFVKYFYAPSVGSARVQCKQVKCLPAVVAMPTQEELILTLMKVNVSEPESI